MPKVTGSNNQTSSNDSAKESRVIVDTVVTSLKEMKRIERELQSMLAASHAKFMAMLADTEATSKESTAEVEAPTSTNSFHN